MVNRSMLFAVLLISSLSFAGDVPTAAQARQESVRIHNIKVALDTAALWDMVKLDIADSMNQGGYSTSFVVTRFEEEAIHLVNQKLRSLGYKCETFIGWNGDELDTISWEPK